MSNEFTIARSFVWEMIVSSFMLIVASSQISTKVSRFSRGEICCDALDSIAFESISFCEPTRKGKNEFN